ncbi:hypothetical protein B0H17DRAFT_1207804 [Mycena rosella]|uniref:CxC2-like cysteine cluster KDZ transposase-associated domain-containing protein n=1 Tax=Mycena rosella TaxID=1033263 RepID=A0AAD7D2Q9_MYCRO|nr:hypothetical protein B0H17DRAFT_1207804 [Mycena rosella]
MAGCRPALVFDVAVSEPDGFGAPTPSADRGVYFSADGRRRQEELLNIRHKKRRVQPSELADSYGEWIPVPRDEEEEGEDIEWRDSEENPMNAVGSTTLKRKGHASLDDPMSLWRPLKGVFGDELLRHDGLGDDLLEPKCGLCQAAYDEASAMPTQMFKCGDCGQFLQCKACCIAHHATSPLHVIKEWKKHFWVDISLADLGLVYQLGHSGLPCKLPDARLLKMTVIEAPIIHRIHVWYCKCGKHSDGDTMEQLMRNVWYSATVTDPSTCAMFKTLEVFRLYNVTGNMNVHDFIRAMERATDATAWTGMKWLPNRYKQFQRMARQWAFLKRIKRAGGDTTPPGWTLPSCASAQLPVGRVLKMGKIFLITGVMLNKYNWQLSLYAPLAVDANFKLKNRKRANEIDDPPLGPGWSYWVEPTRYKHHLSKYVGEKDYVYRIRSFIAEGQSMTTGLRCSGVGGVVCARYECVRPNGMGALQKGERYANMDYIVMSVLVGFTLMMLTLLYDIACQWKTTLPERNEKMPKVLRLSLEKFTLQCALPVWHAGSHNEQCQDDNSLSFKPGVGKSDGEGVERVWAVLNPAAYHTKDAGCGQRVDVLEDKIDSHNFLKNIGQGDALQRKLIVALAERQRQVAAFKEVNETVEPEVIRAWKKMIASWLKDPTKPNPYTLSRKDCPTEAEVRLEVKRDEDTAMAGGTSPLTGRSATAFLVAGLQIEEAQRRIISETAGVALVTADREEKLHDWRRALLAKIAKFRELQAIYMPGAAASIALTDRERDQDAPSPQAERIKLFMPSQMPNDEAGPVGVAAGEQPEAPLRGCIKGLLGMETKLRAAQCLNALAQLRARLHAKRHLISFRNANVTGQIQSTKARTLIGQVGERVEACAVKYRHVREALITLNGEEVTAAFRELRPEDVRLDGDSGSVRP